MGVAVNVQCPNMKEGLWGLPSHVIGEGLWGLLSHAIGEGLWGLLGHEFEER